MISRSVLQAGTIFFLVFLLWGCGENNNTRQLADMKAEQYLKWVQEGEFQLAADLYEPKFRDNALLSLESRNDKLGRMLTSKLITKEINTVYSGKYFIYEFSSEYEKYTAVDAIYTRHYATDILTLFYSLSDETLNVVSHMAESDGLHK